MAGLETMIIHQPFAIAGHVVVPLELAERLRDWAFEYSSATHDDDEAESAMSDTETLAILIVAAKETP